MAQENFINKRIKDIMQMRKIGFILSVLVLITSSCGQSTTKQTVNNETACEQKDNSTIITGNSISKKEAIDYLLKDIYSDNKDVLSTFSFHETDELWGYEGLWDDTSYQDGYHTMVLEFHGESTNKEYFIFWFHERFYYEEKFERDVTSNFYAVNIHTRQIIAERNDDQEFNDDFPDY